MPLEYEKIAQKKKKKKLPSLILLLSIIALTWGIFIFIAKFSFKDWDNAGVFGDSFGAINALFSGLAFAGIIYTIFLQKQELELQRRELRQTRLEFKIQNETLKKQRFENTFFHLLNLHNEIVEKLKVEVNEGDEITPHFVSYESRSVFSGAVRYLARQKDMDEAFERIEDGIDTIHDGYTYFNMEFAPHLSHYFRNLYHTYKYLHLSTLISPEEKQFYSSVIRAQLSDNELVIIFYNMMVDGLGYPNFKYLDQVYNVLENLPESNLIEPWFHMDVFKSLEVKEDPFFKKSYS
ncbi:MAG: hypothetical protein K0S32_3019 [Bacteroidetes bacterium]|jgi:hypothetical protein|nr:hypothetical protein [Bacteroidota bacterium]